MQSEDGLLSFLVVLVASSISDFALLLSLSSEANASAVVDPWTSHIGSEVSAIDIVQSTDYSVYSGGALREANDSQNSWSKTFALLEWMPQVLVDVALGNGITAQIFSGSLHLAGRSQPVIQFRVRDTRRGRVWKFRVQLADEIGDEGDGPRDQPFLSAARRPQYEQARFVAEVPAEEAGGALSTILSDAFRPQAASAARPPSGRPPAHLVRPGLRPRAPIPLSALPLRPGLRPQFPVRPGAPLSALPRERSRSRRRTSIEEVGASSELTGAVESRGISPSDQTPHLIKFLSTCLKAESDQLKERRLASGPG